MYQEVNIVGIMGRDPEMKIVNDRPSCTFPVATSRNLGANRGKETTWFRVTAYGSVAEIVGKMGQKGAKVLCVGRLVPDPVNGCPKVYQKRDGTWTSSFDITASTVQLISNYKSQEVQQSYQNTNTQYKQPVQQPVQQIQQPTDYVDDIPW